MEIQKSTKSAALTNASLAQARANNNTGKRLLYIDNLRWLMIVLVVIMHLNVTYSAMGMWYYVENRFLDRISHLLFGIYGSFTQAYFMGFLFLIAGYFVPGSFDKKGAIRFIGDRLVRLGIPTIVFMVLLHPLTIIIIGAAHHTFPPHLSGIYLKYLTSFEFIGSSGPLWFAFALLIFSLIYALIRVVIPRNIVLFHSPKHDSITHGQVVLVILLITIGAFLLRLLWPIGTAFYNMQFGYFSSYIVLFILGLIAYRRNWFENISYHFGMTWFKIALWAGIPFWFAIMLLGGAVHGMALFSGGVYWQTLAYAFWEAFFCVGVCLGLLVLFREKYNGQGKVSRFLSANAFGVYVFHAPILVAITMLAKNIAIYPLLKMILMIGVCLPVSFGIAALIRKIPGMRKLFS